jgi:hypothetical protein
MIFRAEIAVALGLGLVACGSSNGTNMDADGGQQNGSDGGVVTKNDAGMVVVDPPDLTVDLTHACDDGPNVFFVSPTGNDSAAGTRAAPWQTLVHTAATLNAGQTACVMAGTYNEADTVKFAKAGTAQGYISLIGLDPTRTATAVGETQLLATAKFIRIANLKMRHTSRSNEPLTILGASNIQLVNIELSDSNKLWLNKVDRLLLRDSWIHHNNIGIDCTPGPCTNVAIVNTIVECQGRTSAQACGPATTFTFGGATDGIGSEDLANEWLILRSTIRFNETDGLDIKGSNITVKDSMSYGNGGGGFKIWGGGKTHLENSLSFHNHNGFEFYESAGSTYELLNCTASDNNLTSLAVYADNGHFPTHIDLRNTIFAFATDANTYDDDITITGTSNIYFAKEDLQVKGGNNNERTKAQVMAGMVPDAMPLVADPLFVKRDMGKASDYHVMAGSPAIHSGASDGAPMADIEGTARTAGMVDRGCYQSK